MKRPRLLPLLALVLSAGAAPAADEPLRLETVLPAECPFVLLVEDVRTLLGKGEKSPFARTWNDPEVKKFLAPLRRKMEIEQWDEKVQAETGLTLGDIQALFQGPAALAIAKIEIPEKKPPVEGEPAPEEGQKGQEPEVHAILVAAVGENGEAVEKLLAKDLENDQKKAPAGVEVSETTEEFQGETLHLRQRSEGGKTEEKEGWAILKGSLVLGEPKALLQQVVADVRKGGADSSLASSANFRKVRGRVPRSDALLYVDVERLLPLIRQGLSEIPPNPVLAITPEAILGGLGLDALQAAYLSAEFADEATDLDFGLFHSESRGLLKLLAFQAGAAPRPAFVPEDALDASSMRFSLPACVQGIRETLQGVSPVLSAMGEAQLQQFSQRTGVDIQRDLLEKTGDEIAFWKTFRETEPGKAPSLDDVDQMFAISLKDRKAFETALETLIGRIAEGQEPFEKRDYLDATIRTFKRPLAAEEGQPDAGLHYALTDRYLLLCVGRAAALERAIGTLSKGGGKTVWEKAEVQAAFETLPANPSGLGYQDVGATLAGLFEKLAAFQEQMAATDEDRVCDPAAKPDPKTLAGIWGPCVSGTYRTAEGIFVRCRLMQAKGEAP